MWSTLNSSSPFVNLWEWNGDKFLNSFDAETTTYTQSDMCGEPANSLGWRSPGALHSASIGPLKRGNAYTYQVGDKAYGTSKVFSFVAPPPVDAASGVNMIAFGGAVVVCAGLLLLICSMSSPCVRVCVAP